ncbi:hypothetical protein A1C_03705 [Rickettsia akari str. Hartford]|uniref:Uncharacterized protein n=1 Tax=Rickettsia akari (strain Hartford) TaxID=293614 RepID=A8GNP3_RICAH|nr:hypothetical protein [Rickettsia akari]ABV75018.1 hypothetical protein A1C_03705 [Rickettsia akari str. Hartford]
MLYSYFEVHAKAFFITSSYSSIKPLNALLLPVNNAHLKVFAIFKKFCVKVQILS